MDVRRLITGGWMAAVCFFTAGAQASESLADAAERGDFAAVHALINQQADVNAPQADGMTALHWAAQHGDAETVELLIAHMANLNTVSRYGVLSLSLACAGGHAEVVRLLLKAGADA